MMAVHIGGGCEWPWIAEEEAEGRSLTEVLAALGMRNEPDPTSVMGWAWAVFRGPGPPVFRGSAAEVWAWLRANGRIRGTP